MSQRRALAAACLLSGLLVVAPKTHAAPADVAAIRQARAAMNKAFDAHDIRSLAAFMTETVTIAGPAWRLAGPQQVADAHRAFWADRPDVTWHYTVTDVRVFDAWRWSSERGAWVQRWTATDGPTELRGTYQAFWKKVDGAWRLDAHLFVTTSCTGGAFCQRTPDLR
jgi:ketosteroid isomerase-like protein